MQVASSSKTEAKQKQNLLFADADIYTIPAGEGWNEGYSPSNKFLYFKEAATTRNNKSIWLPATN
ncbi:MAG: hypothetical protein JWQ14_713 [Adhaeribacter sp.]|nr:hypothetical protein [Adhaeribacter sp.]